MRTSPLRQLPSKCWRFLAPCCGRPAFQPQALIMCCMFLFRPLLCSKTRSAAALAAAAAGGHPPPGLRGSPRASGTAVAVAVRRSWRRAVSAALALMLALVLLTQHRQLYRHGQDAAAKLYYGLDPNMLGRSEALFPAPHCCRYEACSGGGSQQRVAVRTYLRDDSYLPLLQQLDCTLRRSNPHLELGLMHVEGELAPATLQLVRALNITLLPVAPLEFPNTYEARWGQGGGLDPQQEGVCSV